MKPSELLVRIHEPKKRRNAEALATLVWDTRKPLALGFPFRYVLEKTAEGFRVRDLSGEIGELQKDSVLEISETIVKQNKPIELDAFHITLSKTSDARPAFATSPELENLEELPKGAELRVSETLGEILVATVAFDRQFAGVVAGRRIFELHADGDEYRLKSLVSGLTVKNGDTLEFTEGQSQDLSYAMLTQHSVIWGPHQWHFHGVAKVNLKLIPKLRVSRDRETGVFGRSLAGSLAALLVLLLTVAIWPKAPVEETPESIPPQYAQVILQRPKPPQDETKPAAPEAAAPNVTKAKDAAVVQAFRAKALQSAVSQLMKGGLTTLLMQSDLVSRNATSKARGVFDDRAKGKLDPGALAGLTKSRDVNVTELGGASDGSNVGYGKGQKAGVAGQGSAFVALDTGGSFVENGLTKDEVGKVIHAHMSEIRYCYESSMIQNPSVEGKLQVDFSIGPQGVVTQAGVQETTTQSTRLDDCVIRRLVKWQFPKPKGGTTVAVAYPFVFKKLGR